VSTGQHGFYPPGFSQGDRSRRLVGLPDWRVKRRLRGALSSYLREQAMAVPQRAGVWQEGNARSFSVCCPPGSLADIMSLMLRASSSLLRKANRFLHGRSRNKEVSGVKANSVFQSTSLHGHPVPSPSRLRRMTSSLLFFRVSLALFSAFSPHRLCAVRRVSASRSVSDEARHLRFAS
jgi:hypothetical protein